MRLFAALACLLSVSVRAVFQDDAFRVDYHHALLGQPLENATFFHQPSSSSRASLIYTLSDRGAVGAVNPKDGSIVWRHLLSEAPSTSIATLRTVEGEDFVYTAYDNDVAAWGALDGRFGWRYAFGDEHVKDVEVLDLGASDASNGAKDVIVITEGTQPSVVRLDSSSGSVKWRYVDTNGDVPVKLSVGSKHIYYISLHKSMLSGYKIRVTELDQKTGQQVQQIVLGTESEVTAPEHVIFLGPSSAVPVIVWTDKSFSTLKMNIIGTKSESVFSVDGSKDIGKITVHAPRSGKKPDFVLVYHANRKHWADVFRVDIEREHVIKSYRIPEDFGSGGFSASVSSGNVYFTRATRSGISVYDSSAEAAVEQYILADFGIPGVQDLPEPRHIISEVLPREGHRPAVRAAILLSSGDWILNLNGELAWHRPEPLVDILSATFAELPQRETLAEELAIEGHANIVSAYVHRFRRHLADLEQLPSILQKLPEQILSSIIGRGSASVTDLRADSFGFHKLVVATTRNGRLVALDTLNSGNVVWSVELPDFDPSAGGPKIVAMPRGVIHVTTNVGSYVYETATGKMVRDTTTSVNPVSQGEHRVVCYEISDGKLIGYFPEEKDSPLWQFSPGKGEKILAISTRPAEDPVASIGRVLGDRNVLYKYLNPNLLLATATDESTNTLAMYLLDSASGRLLYEAKHIGVDTSRPVATLISENWFCYSFASVADAASPSRGYQFISAELYESSIPNDRGPLGMISNYSSMAVESEPYVVAQSYHIPEEISLLAVSHTRQGITSRLVLAVLPESNSIVGIPRQAIDPRRTVDRDPSTPEQMEGLSRYAPVLDFDPRWYLNHRREVLGTQHIITDPAVLESTSLVFAYGFDVFGTRVSPSFTFDILGKDFNKVQMLLTVAALFVGVVVMAPLANRKQINMRWQLGVS